MKVNKRGKRLETKMQLRKSERNTNKNNNYSEVQSDEESQNMSTDESEDYDSSFDDDSKEEVAIRPSRLCKIPKDKDFDEDDESMDPSSIDEENDSDQSNANSEEIEYRVQYILSRKSMTAKEWIGVCDSMNTMEITKGSVLKQPDDEYYSDSTALVEKYLIKWVHASFLHISWETEKDLLEVVGTSFKTMLKRFLARESSGEDLFDDLNRGEYFLPSFISAERVLEVNDDCINIEAVQWNVATIPSIASVINESTHSDNLVNTVIAEDEEIVQFESSNKRSQRNSRNQKLKKSTNNTKKRKSSNNLLHTDDSFLVIKWDGLPYSEVSFESIKDLQSQNVDYEEALRAYYRREQLPPVSNKSSRINRTLKSDTLSQEAPVFPAGSLRDYQWEGVRWLLFNWSQNRNSILADEMGKSNVCSCLGLIISRFIFNRLG